MQPKPGGQRAKFLHDVPMYPFIPLDIPCMVTERPVLEW